MYILVLSIALSIKEKKSRCASASCSAVVQRTRVGASLAYLALVKNNF